MPQTCYKTWQDTHFTCRGPETCCSGTSNRQYCFCFRTFALALRRVFCTVLQAHGGEGDGGGFQKLRRSSRLTEFSAPRSAREDAEMLENEPCNMQVCGGQRQLTTHAQDHTKIIAHSCGDHSCGHAEYNCAATSSVMTIEFRQLRHVYL